MAIKNGNICDVHGQLEEKDIRYKKQYIYQDKTCKFCEKEYREKNKHKRKEYLEKYKNKYIEYRRKNKDKISLKAREYYKNNREKILLQSKKYIEDHKEQTRLVKRNYQNKNKEKCTALILKWQNESIKKLGDNYIKTLLTNRSILRRKDIPIELIELKRQHILLIREIRRVKNGNKNS